MQTDTRDGWRQTGDFKDGQTELRFQPDAAGPCNLVVRVEPASGPDPTLASKFAIAQIDIRDAFGMLLGRIEDPASEPRHVLQSPSITLGGTTGRAPRG